MVKGRDLQYQGYVFESWHGILKKQFFMSICCEFLLFEMRLRLANLKIFWFHKHLVPLLRDFTSKTG